MMHAGMQEPRWTLDELAERVDTALAVDYPGQPSGRVRPVPDRRAIRWYTTIGLVDRPVAHRGRTALYGPRHLLQLVAVKRLQARGLPLVAIQQELAGATDSQLARVARLPESVAAGPGSGPALSASGDGLSGRGRAGLGMAVAARSGAETAPEAAATASPAAAPPSAGARARRARRAGFWREQPAAFTAAADAATLTRPPGPTGPSGPSDPAGAAHPAESAPAGPADLAPGAATLRGVRLGDGATLLLEPGRELGADDVRAVREAAGPLLAVLRERGLGPEPRREHP
jgi:DNA-binding transcriptional MerR regulator